MRIILLLLLMLAAADSFCQSHTPSREVEATDDGIIVTYRFNGAFYQEDLLHEGATFVKIPGFALCNIAGKPCVPFKWDSFVVPDDVEVNVALIDSAYTDTILVLAPSLPPISMNDTLGYTAERIPQIKPYNGFFPESAVKLGDIQNYRGQDIAKIATLPVQYDFRNHTVRSYSMVKYMVNFSKNGNRIKGKDYISNKADRRISLSDNFLENSTLNYSMSTNGKKNTFKRITSKGKTSSVSQIDNRDYLIFSSPLCEDAANKLAEWKRTKGFRTHVIISDNWTVRSIKECILNWYNNEDVNLYYVLFIGDSQQVPAYSNSNNTFAFHVTDYYYGCVPDTIQENETRDLFPSIKRGRIVVRDSLEAMTVVDKIIKYESAPVNDSEFYNNSIHCSFFEDNNGDNIEDGRFVLTSEQIKDDVETNGLNINRLYDAYNFTNPLRWNNDYFFTGDSIPPELRKPTFNWICNSDSVFKYINGGALYVLYSGHGSTTSWGHHTLFQNNNITQLTNSEKLPIVFSIACLTGKYTTNNCFAERFLKHSNGGCVAIIAATEDSYKGFNDSFAGGMFNSMWPSPGISINFAPTDNNTEEFGPTPVYDLGSVFDYGIYAMRTDNASSWYQNFSNIFVMNVEEVFHLFGDPSMMIYSNEPAKILEPDFSIKGDTISINTYDTDTRISFYYTTTPNRLVNSYIGNHAECILNTDTLIICVDKHNMIPFVIKVIRNNYIQNETINDNRIYTNNSTIKIGRKVNNNVPSGPVVINGADVYIKGGRVELHPGTSIVNSKFKIDSSR